MPFHDRNVLFGRCGCEDVLDAAPADVLRKDEEELELMRRDDPVLSQKAESEQSGHSASTYYYLEPGGDDGHGVDGVMKNKQKRGLMESAAVFVVNKRTGGELPPDVDAVTSNLPFVALLQGRQSWSALAEEVKWLNCSVAVAGALLLALGRRGRYARR